MTCCKQQAPHIQKGVSCNLQKVLVIIELLTCNEDYLLSLYQWELHILVEASYHYITHFKRQIAAALQTLGVCAICACFRNFSVSGPVSVWIKRHQKKFRNFSFLWMCATLGGVLLWSLHQNLNNLKITSIQYTKKHYMIKKLREHFMNRNINLPI